MKKSFLFFAFVAIFLGMSSCKAPENIVYLQDVQNEQRLDGAELSMIRIRPGDQLSIVVSSRNPELSAIFRISAIALNINSVP